MIRPFAILAALLLAAPTAAAPRDRTDPRPVRLPTPRARADQEHPGRLLNQSQQQLGRGEIDAAISTLGRVLEQSPQDGFAWSLLADALTWGLGQGTATLAAWRDLADRRPDDPTLHLWAIRAEISQHRADKFTAKDTPWVAAALRQLDPLCAEPTEPPVRYAALLTRRDLLRVAGDRQGSMDAGVQAWTLDPAPLQGRISRIGQLLDQKDGATVGPLCLQLAAEDPWAIEACSGLWAKGDWKDAVATEKARGQVIEAVTKIEARIHRDSVLANEVHKLWKRSGHPERASALVEAVRKRDPRFQPVDADDWWKGAPFRVTPEHQKLFAETNRAQSIADDAQRLRSLLQLESLAPEGSADPIVVRWAWIVHDTAARPGTMDLALQERMLSRLVAVTPEDPRVARERARWLLATEAPADQALAELDRARHLLLVEQRPQRTTNGPLNLDADDTRRATDLATLQWMRAQAYARLGRTEERYVALREASLAEMPAALYAELAVAAEDRGDHTLARWADLRAARVPASEWDALGAEYHQGAGARWHNAHPETLVHNDDPVVALRAAARSLEPTKKTPKESAPKEQHPFVGKAAPALSVTTVDGRALSLDSLKGQVVIVDFWATWCGPCKQEMPELEAMKARLAGKPVTFLMLSVDQDASALPPFLKTNPYSFDIAHIGDGTTKAAWKVKGIPSLFVLGPDGVVARHQQGFRKGIGEDLEKTIRELLP